MCWSEATKAKILTKVRVSGFRGSLVVFGGFYRKRPKGFFRKRQLGFFFLPKAVSKNITADASPGAKLQVHRGGRGHRGGGAEPRPKRSISAEGTCVRPKHPPCLTPHLEWSPNRKNGRTHLTTSATRDPRPETRDPETRDPRSETRDPRRETRDPKPRDPETRDPRPEIRDPRPETRDPRPRDPRPETRHPRPETRDPRPETRDPETRDPRPRDPKTRDPRPETPRPETLS